jgi:hypothetical protein
MFPNAPTFIKAVLIPFRDVIITDGLMTSRRPRSPSAEVHAGSSTKSIVELPFREVVQRAALKPPDELLDQLLEASGAHGWPNFSWSYAAPIISSAFANTPGNFATSVSNTSSRNRSSVGLSHALRR